MVGAMDQCHHRDHRQPERERRPPGLEPQGPHRGRDQHDRNREEQQSPLLLPIHLCVSDRLKPLGDFVEDDRVVDRGRHLPLGPIGDLLHRPT